MRQHDLEPGLPIKLGSCSNGEFDPPPVGAVAAEAMRRARLDAPGLARRAGMDRRTFLRSVCGAAAGLVTLAACSSEESATRGEAPGGTFSLPPESTVDPDVADDVIGGGDFVFDVQNHLLEYGPDHDGPFFGQGFPQADCGEDPHRCFSIEHYLRLVFTESDTSMAVLSAIPVLADPHPLSVQVMERAQDAAEAAGCDGRLLLQGQALPTVGPAAAALDAMSAVAADHDISAWKVYTHAAGDPWFLDDHDPDLAPVGQAFIDRARATGVPVIAVHKGLSGNSPYSSPVDIGPAAAANPDIAFLVYHSGHESGTALGPLDLDRPQGVDRLVASARDHGIGPGDNVYAELGSTWRQLMGDPTAAAHVLGKLLAAFGEDNVIWGTDSIWYGSPQDQIQAFRSFEISAEFQERFGYPELTPQAKTKILGANALRLHGIDPATVPCELRNDERAAARQEPGVVHRLLGPRTPAASRARFAADHPWA